MGDLGHQWSTDLAIYGTEKLDFKWASHLSGADSGQWEVADGNGDVLALGGVPGAPSPGYDFHFSISFSEINALPPFTVRVQALSSNGTPVGGLSSAVNISLAQTGSFGTCFTEAGLGQPIYEKLEAIRANHSVPALGGAIATKSGIAVFLLAMIY